ncbi:MAG: glycosyltransferase, partial [Deltaproteobacteria bacterium]|nr:glycosyltransferase [Deltaproteobacteria bacterium]
MDIGVIPDSNQYGSPMKLFEYMAMKVVPVVPKLPPILDVIQDEVTGFVFDRQNEQSLKEQLIHACENEDLRKQIGKNAREQVLCKHLWTHNAGHIFDVYNKIKAFS